MNESAKGKKCLETGLGFLFPRAFRMGTFDKIDCSNKRTDNNEKAGPISDPAF